MQGYSMRHVAHRFKGYSYEYINPDNFDLPAAYVEKGVLAPERQAYKALVVRASDSMTVPGIKKIAKFARKGLPIILAGGSPSYLTPFDKKGAEYVKKTLDEIRKLKNVHDVSSESVAETVSSLGIKPLTSVKANATWYTLWRKDDNKHEDYVLVYNDYSSGIPTGVSDSEGTVEFQSVGKPYIYDAWTGEQTPILNYTQTKTSTTIFFRLAANQAAVVAFRNKERPTYHAVSTPRNVLAIEASHSGLVAHVSYTSDKHAGHVTTSDGKRHSVKATTAKPFELKQWTLTAEHWDPPTSLEDIDTIAVKQNTTHQLSKLTSWQNIEGLEHVSGRGYYKSSFKWPPSKDASGAVISFGPIVHTIRVVVNGHTIPALDTTSATVDISKYLVKGTNKIQAVVSTTLANVMTPIWEDLRTVSVPPTGIFGSSTKPSGTTDYGLLGSVVMTPYSVAKLD